jgi:vacuolar-type H+-ATPase subunit E/Vma4
MNKKELLLGDYFEAGKKRVLNPMQNSTEHRLEQVLEQNYQTIQELLSKVILKWTQEDL